MHLQYVRVEESVDGYIIILLTKQVGCFNYKVFTLIAENRSYERSLWSVVDLIRTVKVPLFVTRKYARILQ